MDLLLQLRDVTHEYGALRPLRRKVRSPAAGAIDETATVRRATEDDLWLPIYRPFAERWLEMALVVDEAVSMTVWQEVARELRRVFVRAAAFRDVRVWRLATEEPTVGVRPAKTRVGGDELPLTDRCPFGGGQALVALLGQPFPYGVIVDGGNQLARLHLVGGPQVGFERVIRDPTRFLEEDETLQLGGGNEHGCGWRRGRLRWCQRLGSRNRRAVEPGQEDVSHVFARIGKDTAR